MLVSDLAFGELSGPVQVPPASYTLDFKATGNSATAASATTPDLAAGERYLAIATGFLGGGDPTFRLLPLGDGFTLGAATAYVRVVHASPDAPAVDVGTVSGGVVTAVPAFVDLAFEESSTATGTSLPIGSLAIGVAQTGTTAPVATFDLTTTAGLRAFAVAAGSLGGTGESFRLVILDTSVFPWTAAVVFPN